MDILTESEITDLVAGSRIASKYNAVIDSESAYELLTRKLEAAEREAASPKAEKAAENRPAPRKRSLLDDPTIRSMTRTAGNTLVRSLLGVLGLGGRSRRR